MGDQQPPTLPNTWIRYGPSAFNERVGANLQRIRQAAGWSQADLASRLADLGLPFQQPTVLKVEKGTRPLKLEEAHAIAEILEVNMASLTQHVDHAEAAEAIAQIERSNVIITRTIRQREQIRKEREDLDRQSDDFLERVAQAKREAEQKLREAGGHQDDEGRWWWQGKQLVLDASVSSAVFNDLTGMDLNEAIRNAEVEVSHSEVDDGER